MKDPEKTIPNQPLKILGNREKYPLSLATVVRAGAFDVPIAEFKLGLEAWRISQA